MRIAKKLRSDVKLARSAWGELGPFSLQSLLQLLRKYRLSIASGDLLLIDSHWYITHAGLLGLAVRNRCIGIEVQPVKEFCDPRASRYVFCAVVHTSPECKGFVGYGDADPSNVSPLVHGAEMRVAETRAVNRALRKAYGIGICSVEEIGSFERPSASERPVGKLPPEPSNGSNGHGSNRNGNGTRVRDRLCQIIRQHRLDAELVKAYAVDFCGTKTVREASREQVEGFVAHLADWAEKDRDALLCQLNSYQRLQQHVTNPQAGAA